MRNAIGFILQVLVVTIVDYGVSRYVIYRNGEGAVFEYHDNVKKFQGLISQ